MVPNESEERTYQVKSYLSKEQYDYICKAAGGMSVSTYIRNTLLNAGNFQYNWEIYQGDLTEVAEALNEYNRRMHGIIAAFSYRSEIYRIDLQNIEKLAAELNETVKQCLKEIRNNRKAIRKQGEAFVKEKVSQYVKPADAPESGELVGRRGIRKSRTNGNKIILIGAPTGDTRRANNLIREAIEWGDEIEIATNDVKTKAWIQSLQSSGEFLSFYDWEKSNRQKAPGSLLPEDVEPQPEPNSKGETSPLRCFIPDDDDDDWDDDDWGFWKTSNTSLG